MALRLPAWATTRVRPYKLEDTTIAFLNKPQFVTVQSIILFWNDLLLFFVV
jgi:hypothetical protein